LEIRIARLQPAAAADSTVKVKPLPCSSQVVTGTDGPPASVVTGRCERPMMRPRSVIRLPWCDPRRTSAPGTERGETEAIGSTERRRAASRSTRLKILVFKKSHRVDLVAGTEQLALAGFEPDATRGVLEVDVGAQPLQGHDPADVHTWIGLAAPAVLGDAIDGKDRLVEGLDRLRFQQLEVLDARRVDRHGGQVPHGRIIVGGRGAAHPHPGCGQGEGGQPGIKPRKHLQPVAADGEDEGVAPLRLPHRAHHALNLDSPSVLDAGLQVLDEHALGIGQRGPSCDAPGG
jgi:hypothetical protein